MTIRLDMGIGVFAEDKSKIEHKNPPTTPTQELSTSTMKSQKDILSRSKRSFLWMFPNKKEGSKVPDRNYFDIQINETINLEIQIASLIHHFSQTNVTTLTFTQLLLETKAPALTKDFAKLDFRKLLTNIFHNDEFP